MTQRFVKLEIDPFGVAILRLDRPKINALSEELLTELREVAHQLVLTPPKAMVLWGGEKIFAAGAEISEFKGSSEALRLSALFHEALDAVASIPRATIAAINGFALGGGCELALACDFRVAAENAKIGQPEVLLGIIPGGGGTQRLPRLIGPARAKDIIFSGRQIGSEEALSIGLVDRVVEKEDTLSAALSWAKELANGAVVAQGLAKRAIDVGLSDSLEHGMGLERRMFAEVFLSEDATVGIESFFINGPGKAVFKGA